MIWRVPSKIYPIFFRVTKATEIFLGGNLRKSWVNQKKGCHLRCFYHPEKIGYILQGTLQIISQGTDSTGDCLSYLGFITLAILFLFHPNKSWLAVLLISIYIIIKSDLSSFCQLLLSDQHTKTVNSGGKVGLELLKNLRLCTTKMKSFNLGWFDQLNKITKLCFEVEFASLSLIYNQCILMKYCWVVFPFLIFMFHDEG